MTADPLIRLPPALSHPQHRADARFLLGVDGGATKTLAAVLEMQTGKLHLAHGGSSNEDTVGARAAVDTLLATADEALGRAGISRCELTNAVLAIAGTDTAAITRHVHACTDAEQWIVVNDVVAAWAAATGARPGVGAVSGTGSNVFGVGPAGQTWRTGGWGHLLGDEGSGYLLGIQSIRAALRERDGSGSATALAAAAVAFFGASSVEAVADLVYSKPLSKAEIAAFSVETARVANQGDEVARELYTRAAAELGSQILVVVRRAGLGAEDTVVGAEPASARKTAVQGEEAAQEEDPDEG